MSPAGRTALGEEPRFWDPSLGQKGLSLRRLGWGRVVPEDPRWGETKCVFSGVPTGAVNPAQPLVLAGDPASLSFRFPLCYP